MSCLCFLRKRKQLPNELNEVVISDSKFVFGKRKVGKGNCKITSEELSKKSGQSLLF
jgi:vitamin B12 transporter